MTLFHKLLLWTLMTPLVTGAQAPTHQHPAKDCGIGPRQSQEVRHQLCACPARRIAVNEPGALARTWPLFQYGSPLHPGAAL